MEFRPCIDIHNGKVKQIVGGSLLDEGNRAKENFVAEQDAAFFAKLYREQGLKGGHIILLNPGGFQIGGGITAENAKGFLDLGASHVIVTSYVFKDGRINYENLKKLEQTVGKEHLVLDLSCRKQGDDYYIVTDRWQKFTKERVTEQILEELSGYAAEFLVHAVDVEGKASGIEKELASLLGNWGKIPITYAGGVGSFDDLHQLDICGNGKLNVTIGSALDLFGGTMEYKKVIDYIEKARNGYE